MSLLRDQTMLRMLTDVYDYIEYDQSKAKALVRRCIYLLEDDYGNQEEKEQGYYPSDW